MDLKRDRTSIGYSGMALKRDRTSIGYQFTFGYIPDTGPDKAQVFGYGYSGMRNMALPLGSTRMRKKRPKEKLLHTADWLSLSPLYVESTKVTYSRFEVFSGHINYN